MKIDISTLKKASEKFFDHLEDRNIESVDLNDDFYWSIDSDEKYNPYKKPEDITLGQLYDDWEEIQKIASGTSDPNIYSIVWYASLLKYIGEKA